MARLKKRKDGRYQRRVATPDGSTLVYGRTIKELDENVQVVKDRLRDGAPVRDANRPLADWLTEWVKTDLRVSDRAASTKVMYEGHVRTWLVPTLGDVPMNRLNVRDINRLLIVMDDAGKAGSTRRNVYTVLRKALDDAVTNGLLASNPTHKVAQPSAARREARFLTIEEARRLIEAASAYRYAEVLKLILFTGVRRGEAAGLQWATVDLTAGRATLKGQLVRQKGGLARIPLKTDESHRTVVLSPQAVALLRARKAAQAAERLRAGNLWANDDGYVFTTEFGKPIEPQNLLRLTRVAAHKAGLSGVKVHSLRHTYATTALMSGVPLKVVSANMGHANIQITADTYGHVTDSAAVEAAATVADAYGF